MNGACCVTKGDYKRLGERLRSQKECNTDDIKKLQTLRESYKPVLAEVFNILEKCMRTIDKKKAIATYRIKRIESIISKLKRQPTMQLHRMEDIAGCRCIMKNNKDIYSLKSMLSEKLIIKSDRNDYINKPKEDGYRSLHLIVCIAGNEDKPIEIQLRNELDHNWATLVEITDLVYDTKIKENAGDDQLSRLHLLLSKRPFNDLSQDEVFEIISILKKTDFVNKINSIFYNNSIKVRKQWEYIKNNNTGDFYLIKSNKNSVPQILSFVCYKDAESNYFNEFVAKSDLNVVLTYIPDAKFEQISKAYSNYTLTYHRFFSDLLPLLCDLSQHIDWQKFYKVSNLYFKILKDAVLLQMLELIENFSENEGTFNETWKKDVSDRVREYALKYYEFFKINQEDSFMIKSNKYYYKFMFKIHLRFLDAKRLNKEYIKSSSNNN